MEEERPSGEYVGSGPSDNGVSEPITRGSVARALRYMRNSLHRDREDRSRIPSGPASEIVGGGTQDGSGTAGFGVTFSREAIEDVRSVYGAGPIVGQMDGLGQNLGAVAPWSVIPIVNSIIDNMVTTTMPMWTAQYQYSNRPIQCEHQTRTADGCPDCLQEVERIERERRQAACQCRCGRPGCISLSQTWRLPSLPAQSASPR